MVHAVEELFQVQVHYPAMTRRHVLAGTQDRVLRAATRPKAEAFRREGRIKDRLQYLEQGLLDQPVQHRRNAQRPYSSTIRLGDFHLPDRLRNVPSLEQFLTDACPVRLTVAPE